MKIEDVTGSNECNQKLYNRYCKRKGIKESRIEIGDQNMKFERKHNWAAAQLKNQAEKPKTGA